MLLPSAVEDTETPDVDVDNDPERITGMPPQGIIFMRHFLRHGFKTERE